MLNLKSKIQQDFEEKTEQKCYELILKNGRLQVGL